MAPTLHGATPRYDRGLRQVADGVWAWLEPNGDWGEANAGLIRGTGASAVVDTTWDRRLAREMLGAMAPHTEDAPIALAINTHHDGDHWWGNAELPERIDIITSDASARAMQAEPGPGELSRMGGTSRLARRLPGPLRGMTGYVGTMLEPFAFSEVVLRFPNRTFSGTLDEAVGGRRLRLVEVGPAHTVGDLIVHVADAGVVFAADVLFVDATPVMWVGPVDGWLQAIDTLLGLDADTFVPGHGPVTDRAGVEALRDYWLWLQEIVEREHRVGRSPMDAARIATRDTGFARYADWVRPERMLISITAMHRALSGNKPLGHSPVARGRLFAEVATLGRELEAER